MYHENCSDPFTALGVAYYEPIFQHIVYINCSHRVTNNSKYVNTSSCLNSQSKGYFYAMAGDLIVEDFQVGCHVNFIAPTSWSGLRRNQLRSYEVIHKALVYGFEISWMTLICANHCRDQNRCSFDTSTEELQCSHPYCFLSLAYGSGYDDDTCGKVILYYLNIFLKILLFLIKKIIFIIIKNENRSNIFLREGIIFLLKIIKKSNIQI